jgi:thiamine pyrophosphate-dependent acetolactate synthase large subunit-like protein
MDRFAAMRRLMARVGDALVVSNLGSNTHDLYALGDRPENLYLWGGMGLTSSVGLGLALAVPHRRVVVLDGDGSLLMNLGSLATIAREAPANLLHVVFVNGMWLETGGQRIATADGADLAAIGRGAGLRQVADVGDLDALERALDAALGEPGPWLLVARVGEEGTRPSPPVQPVLNAAAFRRAAAGR